MVRMKAGQGAVTQVLPTTDYRSILDAVNIHFAGTAKDYEDDEMI